MESSSRTEPSRDSYDVVVVGGGLGGLSAAAGLAKCQRSVLLLEQGSGVGGCARAFRRGDYLFDPAIHWTGQADPGQLLDIYLGLLGVRDQVNFKSHEHFYGVDFPGMRLSIPSGSEAYIEAHAREFPREREGITGYVEAVLRTTMESQQLPPRLGLGGLEEAVKQFPFLFKYRKAKVQDVLDEFVEDPKAKAVLGAAWPYVGEPPASLSFATFAAMCASALESGPQVVEGSFQVLVDALVSAVETNGGEILVNSPVIDIEVEDGRVTGVSTEGGVRVRAPVVVANADATTTLRELVGVEHLPPNFLRRFERLEPSLSAFVIYAATRLDISQAGLPYEVFIHEHWDHQETAAEIDAGTPGGTWVTMPSVYDSSLAPEGEHLVIATQLSRYDIGEPWEDAEQRLTERLLDQVESLLPGFRKDITHLETATPASINNWTGNHEGAIYGWANTPNQSTPKRLPRVTPIDGLLLSGHWTEPGSGSIRSVYSGLQTTQTALGLQALPEVFGVLSGAVEPPPVAKAG
jgi:prolycopene isomerase